MDDAAGTLLGMEIGDVAHGSLTSMEPTVTAQDPNPDSPGRDGACDNVNLSFLTPSNRAGSLGKIGSYDVYGVLGLGGMGVVFRAFDKALNRTVAVKVQNPLLALDSRSRGRFLKEARAVAAINHPNVVTIYTVDVVRSRPYLVMEFLAGGSLRQRIKTGPPLEIGEVARLSLAIAQGLSAAHQSGLIHRDIKPANILLEGPGLAVKLTDFSLAVANPGESAVDPGKIVGTPAYMSPEQVRGDLLDLRSDLFSLGCVIYAMVAGLSPFVGRTSRQIVDRVSNFHPELLGAGRPKCPARLSDLVEKLLAKKPDDRPASANEVADRLQEIQAEIQATDSPEASLILSPSQKQAVNQAGDFPVLVQDPETLGSYVILNAETYRRLTEAAEMEARKLVARLE